MRATLRKKSLNGGAWIGYVLIAPCMIGIIIFNFIPMAMSLFYSFSTYDIINPPRNFGFHNYVNVFTNVILRDKFMKSLLHTGEYLIFSIIIGLVLSFLLALFLNQKLKECRYTEFCIICLICCHRYVRLLYGLILPILCMDWEILYLILWGFLRTLFILIRVRQCLLS